MAYTRSSGERAGPQRPPCSSPRNAAATRPFPTWLWTRSANNWAARSIGSWRKALY